MVALALEDFVVIVSKVSTLERDLIVVPPSPEPSPTFRSCDEDISVRFLGLVL